MREEDALQEVADELVSRAHAKGMTLFHGFISTDQHALVNWDEGEEDIWAFLDAASDVGARMLYLHCWRFDEEQIENALLALASNEDPEAEDQRTSIQDYRSRLGQVGTLTALFRFDGIFHAVTKTAPWYDEFVALTAPSDAYTVQEEMLSREEAELESPSKEQGNGGGEKRKPRSGKSAEGARSTRRGADRSR
jgi:hypothetical protein